MVDVVQWLERQVVALEIVGSSPTIHPTFPQRRATPAAPAMFDPLAQLAEHLTFNQGVRSSNLRWVTKDRVCFRKRKQAFFFYPAGRGFGAGVV